MQYLSLYTVPALENSLNIFDAYGYYFFGFSENNQFKLDEINKACYLWLWKKYEFSDELSYIKVSKVSEMNSVGEFTVINHWDTFEIEWITKDNENFEKAFKKHLDYFHRKDNGKIDEFIAEKWIYISCNKEKIININEDVLYGYKKLISFPVHLDENGKYISSKSLINTLNINEKNFLHMQDDTLISEWETIVLWNYWVYAKILQLLILSPDSKFDINEHKDTFITLKKTFSFNVDDLRTNTIRWLNKKVSKYLWFEVEINSKWEISTKMI